MRTLEEIAGLAVYLAAGLLFMIGCNMVIEGGATVG
jgi:putative Mn2+ efflux pump MntP